MKLPAFAVGCAAAACLIGATAQAQTTTYDYTGASMSGTETGPVLYDENQGTLPYCCSMLDGSITLASPLAPNLVDAPVTPVDATLTLFGNQLGGTLYAPSSSSSLLQFNPSGSSQGVLFGTFNLDTNSAGQITGWDLDLGSPYPPLSIGSTATITSAGDSETYVNSASAHGVIYSLSNDIAGDWSLQGGGSAEAAPEIDPAGAIPAITMLLGLLAVIRGRRSHSFSA